jgi:ABC-type sugar transport system substrate-binding protein
LRSRPAHRYLDEVIDVLATRAPGLREALERAQAEGTPFVILDGKIVDTDRCREKPVAARAWSSICGTRGNP